MENLEIEFLSKEEVAKGVFSFTFSKPKDFVFSSGQFVKLTVSNLEEKEKSRFFSIASCPSSENLVFVWRESNSTFKQYLKKMKISEKILISKSMGDLTLGRIKENKPVVFISGGLGIVPLRAMINELLEKNFSQEIYCFYSNSFLAEAPFWEELSTIKNNNYKFIGVLTKDKENFSKEKERLTANKIKVYLGENFKNCYYYLVGRQEMVLDLKKGLIEEQINEENIFNEIFDY